MKKLSFLLVVLAFVYGCLSEKTPRKMLGTWEHSDTARRIQYLTITDTGYVHYSFKVDYSQSWTYLNFPVDSFVAKRELLSEDELKITGADSSIRIFHRALRNITPNELIISIYNNLKPGTMDFDTLGDGSLFFSCDLYEGTESVTKLANEVKFTLDKSIGALPIREMKNKHSWQGNILDEYTWENLKVKLINENHYHFGAEKNYLEVKMWLSLK